MDVTDGFGLGSADSAWLFDASGALLDSYSWTAHAATTYGHCFDGTGDFGWVFSMPTYLGQRVVSAAGSIQLTLPASLPAGAHRLAVLVANGNVIGWFHLAVAAAALGATGADADAGLALALLLLGTGGVLVLARLARRRAATR